MDCESIMGASRALLKYAVDVAMASGVLHCPLCGRAAWKMGELFEMDLPLSTSMNAVLECQTSDIANER